MTRLDRLTVVEAALKLLNETGLEGLTLRRIATELDVKAPALYWHFASKQALLDEMATQIMRGIAAAGEPSGDIAAGGTGTGAEPDWRDQVAVGMRALRSTLLSYRDGAKVFSGSTFTADVHAEPAQRSLDGLVRQGFTVRQAIRAWATAYSYTIGFVIEEQAVNPMPGERDPRYDLAAREQRIGRDEFPAVVEMGEELFTEHEDGFETGLAIIVAGIDATFAPRATPNAPDPGRRS